MEKSKSGNLPNINNKEIKEEKSFFDKVIGFFTSNNNGQTKNIRGGYIKCKCPKTHSKYYCDNIYEL